MAVTITQTPPEIVMARSPVIFALNAGSEANESGFMYQLKVFIWTGTIASVPSTPTFILTKPPAPNARTHFDISKLLEAYIKSETSVLLSTLPAIAAGGQVVAYQVKAGSVEVPDQVTSATGFATLGYTSAQDGVNANRVAAGVYSMQPRQIYMKAGVRAWLGGYYDPDNVTFGSITLLGNVPTSVTFTPANNATTLTTQKAVYFGIGTANMDEATLTYGSSYQVNINRSDDTPANNRYTINVACSKYRAHTLYFINRFGLWDFLCFYGNHKRGIDTSATEFMLTSVSNTSGTVTYDALAGLYRSLNNKGRDTYTLNSGWHSEEVYELLQDLMMSQHVIMIVEGSNVLIPVTVESRSISYALKPTDDVISYELQVKVAHEMINQMR